jgi:hypothetical protein
MKLTFMWDVLFSVKEELCQWGKSVKEEHFVKELVPSGPTDAQNVNTPDLAYLHGA